MEKKRLAIGILVAIVLTLLGFIAFSNVLQQRKVNDLSTASSIDVNRKNMDIVDTTKSTTYVGEVSEGSTYISFDATVSGMPYPQDGREYFNVKYQTGMADVPTLTLRVFVEVAAVGIGFSEGGEQVEDGTSRSTFTILPWSSVKEAITDGKHVRIQVWLGDEDCTSNCDYVAGLRHDTQVFFSTLERSEKTWDSTTLITIGPASQIEVLP